MMHESLAARVRANATPAEGYPLSRGRADHAVQVAGTALLADPDGALYWADEKLLLVADLHLEKGSAFARRGVLLPPYDTTSTLSRLARLVEHYAPRIVIALGDCAVTGNIPALRNGMSPDRMIEAIYGPDTTTNGALPYEVVPRLLDRVRPLHEVIPVDYFLHGCPPPPGVIAKAVLALLDGTSPELVGDDLKFG